jgi:sporulation protein YlmC with PRC-barrel domain
MTKDMSTALSGPTVSSRDVEGVLVFDAAGKRLGTIDHLVIERASGHILAVAITGSGFMGLGHAHFQVPWTSLHYNNKRNAFNSDAAPSPK